VYRALLPVLGGEASGRYPAAAIAAWLAVFVAALLTAFELSISDTTSLGLALGAMAGWHALIGIGEAIITVAALSFIASSRPDLLRLGQPATA
jgi:cobalt/nickel transport system permease protein